MRLKIVIIFMAFLPICLLAEDIHNSGYLRIRAKDITTRDLSANRFIETRLRLEPEITVTEDLSIHTQMDVDGVWGERGSLFGFDSEVNQFDFKFNRAWLKWMTPAGLLEIGRMPSDWGLGIFTNDGNGFDDPFGDNYDGDTFDRILFGTKPLGMESPLTTALIFDMVSTGKPQKTEDDVSEVILALLYTESMAIAGIYGGIRTQESTSTEAFFGDIYLKFAIAGLTLEAESVYLKGHTRALMTSLNQGKYNRSGRCSGSA